MIEKYNPEYYKRNIECAIESALRVGLAIELVDNKLSVVNTVANIKSSIDMTPWVDNISFIVD